MKPTDHEKRSRSHVLRAAIAGTAVFSFSLPVATQAQENSDRLVIEEVMVTAQKREESLSKTAAALSVFDQNSIEKIGNSSLNDAAKLVPNLQPGSGGLTLRGIGTLSNVNASPTVPIHYDGVYTASDPRGLASLANYDIAKIEVLRGPQGTLYGRNATAGAINLTTTKPHDEVEFVGDYSYNNEVKEDRLRFAYNQPIAESLALRLAANIVESDGWQKNYGDSLGGSEDSWFVRVAARWQPSESFLWDVLYEQSDIGGVGTSFQDDWYVYKPDPDTAIVSNANASRDEGAPKNPGAEEFGTYEDINRLDAEVKEIRSSLRYDWNENWSTTLISGASERIDTGNFGGLPLVIVSHSTRTNDSQTETKVLSNELNVNYEGDRVSAVVGLYSYEERSRGDTVLYLWIPQAPSGEGERPPMMRAGDLSTNTPEFNTTSSQAAFGQLTYRWGDRTRITGGIRYTKDEQEQPANSTALCLSVPGERIEDPDDPASPLCQVSGVLVPGFGATNNPPAETSFSKWTYKGVVDYDLNDDSLVYFLASTGYKQGFILERNPRRDIEPETNINIEAGFKTKFWDDRASFYATIFRMEYEDLQVNKSDTVDGQPVNTFQNVGAAISQGIELESTILLSANDRIDTYLTYLNAEVTDYDNAPDELRGPAFSFDAKGKTLPQAPETTFRISYTHDFVLGDWGALAATLAHYRQSEVYTGLTNGPEHTIEAYSRSDVFLDLAPFSRKFYVQAYLHNIEDEQPKGTYFSFLTDASATGAGGGTMWSSFSQGQTWGLKLGWNL